MIVGYQGSVSKQNNQEIQPWEQHIFLDSEQIINTESVSRPPLQAWS